MAISRGFKADFASDSPSATDSSNFFSSVFKKRDKILLGSVSFLFYHCLNSIPYVAYFSPSAAVTMVIKN